MQKKSLLATAVLAVALLGSSSAFAADSTNHGNLSAFQNVKTSAVSAEDMTNVSGEFAFLYAAYYYGMVYGVPAAVAAGTWCMKSLGCTATVAKVFRR